MLRRIATPLREFGAGAGLLYLLDRALGMLSPRLRLYAYDLVVQPIPESPSSRRAGSIEVRPIAPDDAVMSRLPVPARVVRTRLEQGGACLGAFRQGQLIGYMWYCPRQYEEDEVRCTFVLEPAAQSVFDFDFFILPEHRMGRGFAALWDGANDVLRASGVRQTFSRVSRFNTASRRAHAHLGGRRIGQAWFLCAWQMQLTLATLPPFVHLGFGVRSRPRLHLRPGA